MNDTKVEDDNELHVPSPAPIVEQQHQPEEEARKRTASERLEHEELIIPIGQHHHQHQHQHLEASIGTSTIAAEAVGVDPEDEIPIANEYDDDEQDAKRLKTASGKKKGVPPPPKKLNNEQWDHMFDRLVAYKNEHGDCLVPKRYQQDPKLGTWVETQRVQYKKLQQIQQQQAAESVDGMAPAITPNKRLNAQRLQRLESIGFAWSAKNLRKTKPPAPSTIPIASAPTKRRASGGPTTDAATKAAARQRLNDEQWTIMYEKLAKYKEEYGDCLVPKKYLVDPKLATWVETQRVLYNRDYRKIPPTTAASSQELPTVGVLPTSGDQSNIEVVAAAAAAAAAATTPDTDPAISTPHPVEGKTPEEWAEELKQKTTEAHDAEMVAATMEAAAMEVVDEVATAAATTDEDKQQQDNAAAAVSTTEGIIDSLHAAEPFKDNMFDGEGDANVDRNLKRLTQDRKDKLDALGFVWSLRSKRVDDHWDDMFQQLVEYKQTHGDCLVPSRYEENFKLGKWVETQRYEYTKLQRSVEGKSEEKVEAKEVATGEDTSNLKPAARPTNPRLTEERLRRLESIGFEWKVKHKMKRYYDRQWDTMFEKLLKYKEQHGHCLVPKRYPPDIKLGTWVHTQRIQYRKLMAGMKKEEGGGVGSEDGYVMTEEPKTDEAKALLEEISFRLTDDRRRRLEEAGFVWSARETEKSSEPNRITRNSYDDQWDAMFEKLREYKQKHGDCLVPKRCKEDPKLGTWVDTQRVQYKKMRKHLAKEGVEYNGPVAPSGDATAATNTAPKPIVGRLTDDRIRRLEELGFVWSLRDDWQKHYDELIEFKKEHGHCNVPARFQKNRRLGIWVSAQRQQYKIMNMPEELRPRRSAPLTMDRVALLNKLGFTWTIRSRDSLGESWNQRLEELRQYKEQFGNCLVPSRYPPNPELGVWVGTQRTQYRLFRRAQETGTVISQSSAMSEERVRQLEALGFVWALRGSSDNQWRKRVAELADYREKHGHSAVPADYQENPRLAQFVQAQRIQYKLLQEGQPSSLDEERAAELDSLGMSWTIEGVDLDVLAASALLPVSVPGAVDDQVAAPVHDITNLVAAPPVNPIAPAPAPMAQQESGAPVAHMIAPAPVQMAPQESTAPVAHMQRPGGDSAGEAAFPEHGTIELSAVPEPVAVSAVAPTDGTTTAAPMPHAEVHAVEPEPIDLAEI